MSDVARLEPPGGVIFDLWDTLTDPVAQAGRDTTTAEVGELLGADGARFARLVRESWGERCRGRLGNLGSTLRTLCGRLDLNPTDEQLADAARHRMSTQAAMLSLRPEADGVLDELSSDGWRLGLLTDSSCETEAIWSGLEVGRRFDAVAFSCSEGRSKPDPLFYLALTGRLGVDPADCVYVADGRAGELAAARRLGMRSVRLAIDVRRPDAEDWDGETIPDLWSLSDLLA